MQCFRNYMVAAMVLLVLQPVVSAEILVFKDGKTMEAEDIREQGNKVSFLFQGVKISVARDAVERIESPNQRSSQPTSLTRENGIKQTNTPPSAPRETINPLKKSPARLPQKVPSQKKQTPPDKVKPETNGLRLDGFRELRWGQPASNVADLQILMSENSLDGVEEYIRSNEVLNIGPAAIESTIYGFWQDRLYTVTIWTKGHSNYRALRQAVFNAFGSGLKPDKATEKYVWSDTKADRMLEYTNSSKYGMLWMRSRKLDRQYNLSKLKRPASYLKRINRDSY